MIRNKIYTTLSLFVASLFVALLLTRCASVGSLSGGPSDSLPPKILAMNPENYSTGVDTLIKKIYIEFDEFVQLKDQQKELFTSPAMGKKPQLEIRGKGVVVTLRDTLRSNTTYAINFGKLIQDNNESNPLYSMRYVFSTGDTIDSMVMSGYTESSYRADSVSNTFILFYPLDSLAYSDGKDSTLFNASPAVIARAESNGIFMAQNLKPIDYQIYAFEDTNSNLSYEPGTDQVGFLDGHYNPANMSNFAIWYDSLRRYVVAEPQLHFRMFMDEPFRRQMLSESSRPEQHKALLQFGASYPEIDSIVFDSIPADRFAVEAVTADRDTLALWFDMPSEQLPDTIRGRVVYFKHDSIRNLVRHSEELKLPWKAFESKEQQQKREREERARKKAEESGEEYKAPQEPNPFKVNIAAAEGVNPEKSVTFDFDYPLSKIDTAAISFTMLTAEQQKLMADNPESKYRGEPHKFTFERDTQNIRRWHFRSEWGDPKAKHYLTIPDSTFIDFRGNANDTITREFKLLDKEEFASFVVDIKENPERPSTYIIELLDEGGSRVTERWTNLAPGQHTLNYIPAGKVMLKVVEDLNDNGKWDSGNLVERRQSERSQIFSQSGESKIETKKNWELDLTIDPAEMFREESQVELQQRLDRAERERLKELAKTQRERAKNASESSSSNNNSSMSPMSMF